MQSRGGGGVVAEVVCCEERNVIEQEEQPLVNLQKEGDKTRFLWGLSLGVMYAGGPMPLTFPKPICDSTLTLELHPRVLHWPLFGERGTGHQTAASTQGWGDSMMFLMYDHNKHQIRLWMYTWCLKRANFTKLEIIMEHVAWEQGFQEKDVSN